MEMARALMVQPEMVMLDERMAGVNPALTHGIAHEVGSIEVGKLADLIVLDRNLFEIDPADISDTRVLLTLFAGKPVHGTL